MSRALIRLCALLLVVVGGVAASTTSARAAMPPNDDFANATELGNGATVSASGSNLWATTEAGEPAHINQVVATVWYRWTAPRSGVVSVRTCGSNFDTTLAVFRGAALESLARVAANDERCGRQSALRYFTVAGTTYHIAIGGFFGAQGSIELRVHLLEPPTNDNFADARDLGNRLTASASDTNREATIEPREPDHADQRTIGSVWYRWTAPASRRVRIESCGSDFDTMLAVYVGEELDALRAVASNDDECGLRSVVKFKSAAGTTYRIALAGFGAQQGTIKLKLAPLERKQRRGPRRTDRS
jgi:hypothetical protein